MEYDDIINLPHHQSGSRPHISLLDRAAQFAPFAALNGHSLVIRHAADSHIADINAQLYEDDYLLTLISENDNQEI